MNVVGKGAAAQPRHSSPIHPVLCLPWPHPHHTHTHTHTHTHIHTHTHTHTHTEPTRLPHFPWVRLLGQIASGVRYGCFCIFGGKVWRSLNRKEDRKHIFVSFSYILPLLTQICLRKKKKSLENPSSICHLEMTMWVLFHISASSLSSSLMFQILQSIYSFILLEAKQFDVRTDPGALATGVGSFRTWRRKLM